MPVFVVHSIPGSPFGRSVSATLEEKGVPWRLVPVRPGTLKDPEHRALHPFGRIPVLEHGDFRLYETQAILRYIDRVAPRPPLTPADPRSAAEMDRIIAITDWYLFHGVGEVIGYQRIVKPFFGGGEPDIEACAAAMPQAMAVFGELSRLLGYKTFMTGDSLSLADLHLAPHMDFLSQTPEWAELTVGRENLLAWLARLTARPSMTATTWERLSLRSRAA